jgi:deazaflavin-dependent oxidoreductase (nitroreductase family)
MAYLRPGWFTRKIFNPLATRLGISGVLGLSVIGRSTGQVQTVPVLVAERDGRRYLVSPRGETEWVRNLRAAGGEAEIKRRRDKIERVRAVEVPVGERAPILEVYQRMAGRAVKPYFKKLPDPSDHPVFRIDVAT